MPDPLLSDYPLPLYKRFYPLGFALDIFTNSEAVLDAAEQSWGLFHQTSGQPPKILRVGVMENEFPVVSAPPVYRGHRNVISIISDSANYAICDLDQGFAYSWLTSALVRDAGRLRYFFLEASAYLLVVSASLAGVHAACVQWQGRGVLLAGDSGAGKSSMAYACARSGWTYTSDDASYIVRGADSLEIVGNPYLFRLRTAASLLFPELAGSAVTSHPYRKETIEVPSSSIENVRISCRGNVQAVVFLNRNGVNAPQMRPFPKEEALRIWSQEICFGDDQVRSEHALAYSKLLALDVYELRYAEVFTAVRYLESFLTGEK